MSEKDTLADAACIPCQGGIAALGPEKIDALRAELKGDWTLSDDGKNLTLQLQFKGYAKPVYHANLAAWLADQEGHHPDVSFGWGYCNVTFTTHDSDGLTENDFICAAKFDRLLHGE